MGAKIMNELTTDIQFSVDFKPSEIKINNEEQLEKMVNSAVAHYSSLVFTDDNITEAKEARTDLNKVIRQLDDERKAIKKEYSAPLTEFEKKIKSHVDRMNSVISDIRIGIDDFEAREKQIRFEKINALIAEMSPNYEISTDEIILQDKWLNKGAFTTKGEPNKKTIEEIANEMTLIAKEKKRIEDDKSIIVNYAKAVGLEPDGWSSWIDNGHTSAEVMKQIDKAVQDKKDREEHEIAVRKAHEEYEQAMKELRERKVDEKVVDTETGEIITEDFETTRQEIEDRKTVTLRLTGTHEQLSALNNFIVTEGIKVEVV